MRPAQFAFITMAVALLFVIAVLLIKRPSSSLIANQNSVSPNSNEANQNSQVAGAIPIPSNVEPTPNQAGDVTLAAAYQSAISKQWMLRS